MYGRVLVRTECRRPLGGGTAPRVGSRPTRRVAAEGALGRSWQRLRPGTNGCEMVAAETNNFEMYMQNETNDFEMVVVKTNNFEMVAAGDEWL